MIKRARDLYGERTAILDDEGELSWSQFVDRITRAADLLRKLGLEKGDRYAIVACNSFRQAELTNAGYWSGCIPVPVNYRLAPKEIAEILEDADCKFLILEDGFAELLQSDELASFKDRVLFLGAGKGSDFSPSYDEQLPGCEPAPCQIAGEDDLAILIYTGGTTGRSKGVRLTHRNIFTNGMQLAIAFQATSDDVYMHVSPMFHSADFIGNAFTHIGAAHVYLAIPTPRAILEKIEAFKVTKVVLSPTLIIGMLTDPEFDRFDLSSLRCLIYGTAPMAAEWVRKMMEAFPHSEFSQGYGLSETSPVLTVLDHETHCRARDLGDDSLLKSAGRPLVGVEVCIVGGNDREVAAGEIGEVTVRGANVSQSYHNLPSADEAAFKNGWFHTGDLGRVDEHGYLHLIDRKKDMIITGGENVYSAEVEAAIYQHQNVHETAVIGIPDNKYGEAVFAVIVPKPGSKISEDEIIAHCRDRIGGYKIPRQMVFVEELPKSAVGKILKTELRKQFG